MMIISRKHRAVFLIFFPWLVFLVISGLQFLLFGMRSDMGNNQNLKNDKGFTLIELLIVIAIIGILATTAVSQFVQYKNRAYDSSAKADLHNLFLSCKAFWGDTTGVTACVNDAAGVQSASYGFQPTANNVINITNASELTFAATAQYTPGGVPTGTLWSVGPNGNIS